MVLFYYQSRSNYSNSYHFSATWLAFLCKQIYSSISGCLCTKYIILPTIVLVIINLFVDAYIRSPRHSLNSKEFISLSLFMAYAFILSMTHDHAIVLLCSYVLPILASTIFNREKLTRSLSIVSVCLIWIPAIKWLFSDYLNSDILMEIFASLFMIVCAYFLAKVLIQYGQDNRVAILNSHDEALKNELAFLQAQIKPHFLCNALNTIVSFSYNDKEKANALLIDLSSYLRLTFTTDPKSMMEPLEKEIELIKYYVEIEKARYGDAICVEYDIDPALNQMKIPSFCLQPLVENAIKHGLCEKETGGTVYISGVRHDTETVLEVRDTGMGMSEEKLCHLRTNDFVDQGMGFVNVKKRIGIWKTAYLDVNSTENEGTSVKIHILD